MTATGIGRGRFHIGIVFPSMAGGGAERALLTLAHSLIERGSRVDLFLLSTKGEYRSAVPDGARIYRRRRRHADGNLLRYFRARNIETHVLPVSPLAALAARRSLRRAFPEIDLRASEVRDAVAVARYFREARPEISLAGLPGPNNAAVLAAELTGNRVPVIVSIRNNVALSPDYSGRGLALARALMPRADAAVAVSQGVAGAATETLGLDAGRVRAIYNPKPLEEIRRLAEEKISHPWFGGDAPPVILTVLREASQKDWATLLTAFGHVRRKIPARLVVLGSLSEGYRARMLEMAGSFGVAQDVAFTGFDENPFRYMRRAALFVLSSRWEGLPNVLIEAMACGTAAVSTDAPYGPAEILEDGRWGRLVPVGDAEAMAQAIIESLEGGAVPAEALRRRTEDFSTERAVAAYEALFLSLTERIPGR